MLLRPINKETDTSVETIKIGGEQYSVVGVSLQCRDDLPELVQVVRHVLQECAGRR